MEEDLPAFFEHVRRQAHRNLVTPERIERADKRFEEDQRKRQRAQSERDAENNPDLMRDSYTDGIDEEVL